MSLIKHSVRFALAAAAAAAAANSASALDISTYSASSFTNIYLSGSTAVDNTIANAALETASPGGVCQAGTVDIYYIGTTGSYTNRLILCTASSSAGVSAGTPLAIFKESVVGSANGVVPLYTYSTGGSSGLTFIDPIALKASGDSACTTATVAASGNIGAYTTHASCPAADVVANGVPTAGFSDVEASILKTANNSSVNTKLAGSQLKGVGTLDQVWGIALTKNAYYALQAAEGYASPSDSPANAPSLSKQDVAGLLSGNVFLWSDLGVTNTGNGGDENVYICRRDNGSGTEASFEAYFLGQRCSLSSETIPSENGTTVFANGSGGGMRSCLQHFFSGGNQVEYYPPNNTVALPGGQFAVGLLNAEVTASNLSGANDSFRFVAIDGVGPTVANVQNGYYPYFSTGVAYTIKAGQGVPTGNAQLFLTAFLGKLGHPQFTADSNSSYVGVKPWSPSLTVGDVSPAPLYASTNFPAVPATSATAATNPTNAYTKAQSGSVNNCDTPVWDSGDLEGISTTTVEKTLLGTGQVNN